MLVHRIDTLNCTKRTQDPRYVKGGWVGGRGGDTGTSVYVYGCCSKEKYLRSPGGLDDK